MAGHDELQLPQDHQNDAASDQLSGIVSVRSAELQSGSGDKLKLLDPATKLREMGGPCKLVIRAKEPNILEDPTNKCCPLTQDVGQRIIRCLQIILIPTILLLVLNELTNGGEGSEVHWLSRMVGINICVLFNSYFLNLAAELYPPRKCCRGNTNAYLFKVKTRMTRVPEWAEMRIANTQLVYMFRPIQSISEFSAISGGLANHMIANLGPISWVMVVMLFASHMQCLNGNGFSLDIADFLILVGVSGIVVIGIFELNQFEIAMKHFHYLGVAMSICILIASLIQGFSLGGGHRVFPILMNVVAWPCFLYWQYISTDDMAMQFEERMKKRTEKTRDSEDEDPADKALTDKELSDKLQREINTFSLKCVVLEGLTIYCVTMALAYYMFMWGSDCGDGCASRWYHNVYSD